MNDPSRVRVTGPMAGFADGYRAELEDREYAPATVALKLQLMAELSRWLEARGLGAGDLTPGRVEEFFAMRRERVRVLFVSPLALGLLLDHLRDVGVLAVPTPAPPTPLEVMLGRYRVYLAQERALGERTIVRYVDVARRFLMRSSTGGGVDLGRVSGRDAVRFLTEEGARCSSAWAKAVAVVLRSFLGFLYLEGLIDGPLAQAVPTPAGWSATVLPEALKPAEVSSLLVSCDRRSVAGRRDYAVLLLLVRLGLRAGEAAGIELDDIDWRGGELRICGKAGRVDVLPLPVEVGRALADYVRMGRPRVGHRVVFCRICAPHTPLVPSAVTQIVYRCCDRAGLRRVGSHRLRHTAATRMLGGGASLPEIGQVLRHTSTATTAIYAKVDRRALSGLAQSWPGGAV